MPLLMAMAALSAGAAACAQDREVRPIAVVNTGGDDQRAGQTPGEPGDPNIGKYERLIRVTGDDDPLKPDFLHRLGNLYRAQADRSTQLPPDRAAAERRRWVSKAAESYIAASQFLAYAARDEVLFSLACLLQDEHKDEAARSLFEKVIAEYPASARVPEARARLR